LRYTNLFIIIIIIIKLCTQVGNECRAGLRVAPGPISVRVGV